MRFSCWVPVIDVQQPKQPRIVVQGGKRTFNSLQGCKPGDVVSLVRGTAERDTCLFSLLAPDSIDILHRKKWSAKIPFDIRPYLFHLWQLRDLSSAFGLQFFASIHTEEIEAKIRTLDEDEQRHPGV